MNSAARRAAAGGAQPGPGRYGTAIVVLGKVLSMTAATIWVISCASSELISVSPDSISWRQANLAVLDQRAPAAPVTGASDSNLRSAAGSPVCSSASVLTAAQGTCTTANVHS